ncbi:uncharacterized protein BKA78DRAFT_75116 [Phyllosticta capitalensis]|uniref:uncharacterized protein n=1 Tax=Phyllosticta capitalensis TaxID=121624 RepID=UPI00312DD303
MSLVGSFQSVLEDSTLAPAFRTVATSPTSWFLPVCLPVHPDIFPVCLPRYSHLHHFHYMMKPSISPRQRQTSTSCGANHSRCRRSGRWSEGSPDRERKESVPDTQPRTTRTANLNQLPGIRIDWYYATPPSFTIISPPQNATKYKDTRMPALANLTRTKQ